MTKLKAQESIIADDPSTGIKTPFCSIIVLNFNGGKIIKSCIDALLRQDYPDFEIIVVENASADDSLEILKDNYADNPKVRIVVSKKNLGCPGGRNLGLRFANGEIVAFIDNDAVPRPDWLSEAVSRLTTDPSIGGVASVLFFEKRKEIVNSAGGTLNLLGYGGDICYKAHAEFAELPEEVLYAPGCGMVYWRAVFRRVGNFDEQLFNYYDDVDIGFRTHRMGKKVVLAPSAQIMHRFSYSDAFNKNKVYLCERNRIRNVLKHFSASQLFGWMAEELRHEFRHRRHRSVFLKAWAWNFLHLPSAARWRWKLRRFHGDPSPLLVRDTGYYPYAAPNNLDFAPDAGRLGDSFDFQSGDGLECLNHGWYQLEKDTQSTFRWATKVASCLFRLHSPKHKMTIMFRFPPVGRRRCHVSVRRVAEAQEVARAELRTDDGQWQRESFPADLDAGTYEIVMKTDECYIEPGKRMLGIAISGICFE